MYIPDVIPVPNGLKGVGGGGNPVERRGGKGGPTGSPLASAMGGKQSPAAAALRKSMLVDFVFLNLLCVSLLIHCTHTG